MTERPIKRRGDWADICAACGKSAPGWPARWLFTNDNRAYCPACRTNVTVLKRD